MGLSQQLHKLAIDFCQLANVPGPSEHQRTAQLSIYFIDTAIQAIKAMGSNEAPGNITLLTMVKRFFFRQLGG